MLKLATSVFATGMGRRDSRDESHEHGSEALIVGLVCEVLQLLPCERENLLRVPGCTPSLCQSLAARRLMVALL